MKKIFLLLLLSVLIATALFYTNNVIVYTASDMLFEIAFIAVPVFILLSLLYLVNRALIRKVKGLRKKKPSAGEGSDI